MRKCNFRFSIVIQAYMSVLMRGILISTRIQAYMSVLMRGILISTLIQAYMSVLMKGIVISTFIQAYMSVLMGGILISTLIQAYMSVLMRGILISTLIQAYMSVLMRGRKLDTQRKLEKAVMAMVYKSLNGLAPDYLRPMFIDRSSITNYSLRDTEGKLAIPKPRTNYLKNSFGYSGAVLWNSLPT